MSDKTVGKTGFGYGEGDKPLFRVEPGHDAKLASTQGITLQKVTVTITFCRSTNQHSHIAQTLHNQDNTTHYQLVILV